MSSNGTVLAIGAKDNKEDIQSGSVRVFVYDGDNWVQRGLEITGENGGGRLGNSLAISEDGSILAIGAVGYDSDNGVLSGQMRVVELESLCSREPSMVPSYTPTSEPSSKPSSKPTSIPTSKPQANNQRNILPTTM